MLQIWGTLKEKMGKPVNKANFVRSISEHKVVKIGQKYYGDNEEQIKFQGQPTPVAPDRAIVQIGQLHIAYALWEKGQPVTWLRFNGGIVDGMSPQEIDDLSYTNHVKTALRNAAAGNIGMLIVIMGLGIGLAVGFLLGQNLPAIQQAISGPTPTPAFGGP